MKLNYGFKLHGVDTVNGDRRSSQTSTFYPTYRDAEKAAERMVNRQNFSDEGIVIFKAVAVVKPTRAPTETVGVSLPGDEL